MHNLLPDPPRSTVSFTKNTDLANVGIRGGSSDRAGTTVRRERRVRIVKLLNGMLVPRFIFSHRFGIHIRRRQNGACAILSGLFLQCQVVHIIIHHQEAKTEQHHRECFNIESTVPMSLPSSLGRCVEGVQQVQHCGAVPS